MIKKNYRASIIVEASMVIPLSIAVFLLMFFAGLKIHNDYRGYMEEMIVIDREVRRDIKKIAYYQAISQISSRIRPISDFRLKYDKEIDQLIRDKQID